MLRFFHHLQAVQELQEIPRAVCCEFSNFDAESDAKALKKAVEGLGTDEDAIIDITVNRNNYQRQQIKKAYKTFYGVDLTDDLSSDLSGNFCKVICGLYLDPVDFQVTSLYKATKGLGTTESILIDVICTQSNADLREIKCAYKKKYDRTLEKDIKDDTRGSFKRLLVSLLQASRDEGTSVDMVLAYSDAKALYEAGEGRLGTSEDVFIKIFATRSYAQLQATFTSYFEASGRDIIQVIESEFSGDIKRALLAIVHVSASLIGYFATRLHASLKGIGTDETTLNYILVSQSEKDIEKIKKAFSVIYKKELSDVISADTSGDYKKVCLALI